MRLTALHPKFIRREVRDGHLYQVPVETLADAQGIRFDCPKCKGTRDHAVVCWSRSRGIEDSDSPGPGRWRLDGTGYDDLSLNAEQPNGVRSVQLKGGCAWHGFITNGLVTDA